VDTHAGVVGDNRKLEGFREEITRRTLLIIGKLSVLGQLIRRMIYRINVPFGNKRKFVSPTKQALIVPCNFHHFSFTLRQNDVILLLVQLGEMRRVHMQASNNNVQVTIVAGSCWIIFYSRQSSY
jgi:hypothetical protein